MLKITTTEKALDDFWEFWKTFFPEQDILTRESALAKINERERGGLNTTASDTEMVPYQNDVAKIYGAYEKAVFQEATMRHIIGLAKKLPEKSRIVSLGCGPASYELWLLTQTNHFVTLVDHSPGMLARANTIAVALGITDRITMIESDAGSVHSIPDHCADLVLCLNSAHWSKNWREWIMETARIVKHRAGVLVTCTLKLPRSSIEPGELGKMMVQFFHDEGHGLLVPPTDLGYGMGMSAISMRFYCIGRRMDKIPKNNKSKK